MSAVGDDTEFPRTDNYFIGMESHSYQEGQAKIWKDRQSHWSEVYLEWLLYALMGIGVGITAFSMELTEESLVHFKDHFTQNQID